MTSPTPADNFAGLRGTIVRWLAPVFGPVLRQVQRGASFLHRPVRYRQRQLNPLRLDAWCWGRRNQGFRQAMTVATILHLLLVLGPQALVGCHSQAAYGLKKGSGSPTLGGREAAQEVVIRKTVSKKRKTFAVNPNSAISFYVPQMEDSKVLDSAQEATQNTYQATGGRSTGRGGRGGNKGRGVGGVALGKGGGTTGGWPEGMDDSQVRFIRLEYDGGDWDHNMGADSDYNLLLQFRDVTGFKIAARTEHLRIGELKYFPRDRKPPFVYLTGMKAMNLTSQEIKTLRWYCLEEGGLLFIDNGGGDFDHHVRQLASQAFPGLAWTDIPNDDIIYQQPFDFPNGAPPLFHHSGNRALGIKSNGRWVVFYHQGDIGDAWKTGHTGVAESVAQASYELGINVINYAFNQYTDMHPAK